MIELKKALEILGNHVIDPGSETIPLQDAHSRILAEDVFADRDMPPFNKSSMDGYACRREDLVGPLLVTETIQAGAVPKTRVEPGHCSRIMTGARVPEGADCVIMQEYADTVEEGKIVFTGKETNSNICKRGEDTLKGELLLNKGTMLKPQHVGLLASIGKTEVNVYRKFSIGIIATGDELIEPGKVPEDAEIRNSNAWQLMGQIRSAGHHPVYLGIVPDDRSEIKARTKEALGLCDMLILTGGASVGEYDLVAGVLDNLGFTIAFEKVAIQPGKPFTFAFRNKQVCFGLSGNPVSCFLQFELLVKPFLIRSSGGVYMPTRVRYMLNKDFIREQSERQFFLPVVLSDNGYCTPVVYHGSAHLHALTQTVGFAEIPVGNSKISKGEEVYVRLV
jgi:molybdopterin molybdotransferase